MLLLLCGPKLSGVKMYNHTLHGVGMDMDKDYCLWKHGACQCEKNRKKIK